MDTEALADLMNESALNTPSVAEPTFLAAMAGGWFVILLLVLWAGVWKAWALWRAARNEHLGWYIALTIFYTLGILEIVYIFAFSNYNKGKKQASAPKEVTSEKTEKTEKK